MHLLIVNKTFYQTKFFELILRQPITARVQIPDRSYNELMKSVFQSINKDLKESNYECNIYYAREN